MKTSTLLAALLGLAITSSVSATQSDDPASLQASKNSLDQEQLAAGFRALESSCFSCHSPNAAMDNRIAPPMAAIKKHYINSNTSFEDFSRQLAAFVDNPTAENAKMPGAIRKFGVMPKMPLDSAVITQIAYYIYHSSLEAPEWFERHYQDEQRSNQRRGNTTLNTNADYLRHGKKIALSTKAELGSNLKQALNTGDTVSAIGFCQDNAIPISERMSQKLKASITRVSDRPRNPDNKADKTQMQYIVAAKKALAQGEQPKPLMQQIDDQMVGYYPIVTNAMCLQCHGTNAADISADTAAALDTEYPLDQARGYGLNELRGIFVVSMDKE
ncbi:DUF3365 domain-containing protein [Congregibacter variabilis]|uniref:DUF3365 domain-containing protein n=1 Tax=Congregibacter variabilis TaxID=3081200 RepID=A0ABZ0I9H6_9GAMM|nr:DUF3365 domain-containing protein [Congregibacter sp. IMCC43200]